MKVLSLALALATLSAAAPVPVSIVDLDKRQDASACAPLEIIFARGTTEPQGLGTLGAPLQKEVAALVSGTKSTAVVYPANANFMGSASTGSTVSPAVGERVK